MKDKNLPDDNNSKSLEKLTQEINRIIEELEKKEDIKNSLDDYPELIHILKTGFDLEYDSSTYETTIQSLTKVIEIILKSTHE